MAAVAGRVGALLDDRLLSISDQARLEILFSARSEADHRRLSARLSALPTTTGGHRVWRRALQVQGLLAAEEDFTIGA